MIDGEIYIRTGLDKAVFAYRECNLNGSIPHYAAVFYNGATFVRWYNGSTGIIGRDETRMADDVEISYFHSRLKEYGFKYNKSNKKLIKISTGEIYG